MVAGVDVVRTGLEGLNVEPHPYEGPHNADGNGRLPHTAVGAGYNKGFLYTAHELTLKVEIRIVRRIFRRAFK